LEDATLPEATNSTLAELLDPLVTENGFSPTGVPGLEYMRAVDCSERHPIIYTPRIVIVAQGSKRVWLGDESYVYDANNYLVLAAPMPMECATTASPDEPLLGFVINVDPIMVGELLLEMGDIPNVNPTSVVKSSLITEDVIDAATRLTRALSSPIDARILGPQIVREIVYRVLRSENGEVLRLLTSNATRYGQIARVLRKIHTEYASELEVASLAQEANMGASTFHQAFKEVTATSPVQYVKQIRLHRARMLLTVEGVTAQEAARRVGYASPTQFSREYRRMFGTTPATDRSANPV
jgi:AraC-like DNA-binding protein